MEMIADCPNTNEPMHRSQVVIGSRLPADHVMTADCACGELHRFGLSALHGTQGGMEHRYVDGSLRPFRASKAPKLGEVETIDRSVLDNDADDPAGFPSDDAEGDAEGEAVATVGDEAAEGEEPGEAAGLDPANLPPPLDDAGVEQEDPGDPGDHV